MTFRKDINGLRTIAILVVLLFHFRVAGFTGGFSGVDIFFVISGFLMTAIIFTKLDKNQFSLIDFYLHRARRIIPALAVLCLVIILLGFRYLLTDEYRETLRNVKSAIQFTSNYKFYDNFDYFASPSQENWLLHTWSLSVEWQFYLVYPLIILLLRKCFNLLKTKVILIILALVSLSFTIYYTPVNSSAAFFFLPTRAWELLAGSIVYLLPLRIPAIWKKLTGYLGFTLVVIAVFSLNEKQLWPGYLAIIPVLGAMLIIWSEQNSLITNNRISQWLGKISYSVYLWHWPIVVLLLTSGLLSNIYCVISGIVASLVLGHLSYWAIEKRIKLTQSQVTEFIKYLAIIAIIMGLAASLASVVKRHPHLRDDRLFFSPTFQKIEQLTTARHPDNDRCMLMNDQPILPECQIGKGEPTMIVMGDSHANAVFSAIQAANNKGSTLLWAHMGCPIVKGIKFTISRREGCIHLIKDKLALLDKSYPDIPVLIVNRLYNTLGDKQTAPQIYFSKPAKYADQVLNDEFREHYLNTLCTLTKKRPVFVLKPIPEAGFDVPKKLTREWMLGLAFTSNSTSLDNYYKKNAFILKLMQEAKQQCSVVLLDPIPYLCPEGKCLSSDAGKPFYFDDNHLTEYGNKQLLPLFKNQLFISPKH